MKTFLIELWGLDDINISIELGTQQALKNNSSYTMQTWVFHSPT